MQKKMGAHLSLVGSLKGKTIVVDRDGSLVNVYTQAKPQLQAGQWVFWGLSGTKDLTRRAIKSIMGHYSGAMIMELGLLWHVLGTKHWLDQ